MNSAIRDLLRTFNSRFKALYRPPFWVDRARRYCYIWVVSVSLLAVVSLMPLTLMVLYVYNSSQEAIYKENVLRILRITSNTRRTVASFFEQRLNALRFTAQVETYAFLSRSENLAAVLKNLKYGFGGIVDLGLIEASGIQVAYTGPFDLTGKDYSGQDWFKKTLEQGGYVSDVFLGYRGVPHMIVAVRSADGQGRNFVLRATLDLESFSQILRYLELSDRSVCFLINREGIVQTPSGRYGNPLEKVCCISVPEYAEHSQVLETKGEQGKPLMVGYAYISDSPFILLLVKDKREIMQNWYELRQNLIIFFLGSFVVIFLVFYVIPTYIIQSLYEAEQTHARAIQRLEETARLASLGRLAAGVAHEINNPLAIINEKAGLIKDLIIFKEEYKHDKKLESLIDSVLGSVERCGAVTKQLLGFARHTEVSVSTVPVRKIIGDVLSFLEKEASYRNITLNVEIPDGLPSLLTDKGKVQQIFLNLINNAFQAVGDGGRIDIVGRQVDGGKIAVRVSDNGCGISDENLQRIFEPFFSTKKDSGGTGLGLSITYGLVQRLGGQIAVESELGKGTTFTVTLPVETKEVRDEGLTCG
ncbi:MAG TPA: ATP-binding protein [Syntrophobacteria bacterium]|nr:ATP-binding protein [Syntrophobacteria bacterium]